MRAITVQQPWAWAIIHGGKNVENRTRIGTWRPAIGERVAVHAGVRMSCRGQLDGRVLEAAERRMLTVPDALDPEAPVIAMGAYSLGPITLGAVIGTVDVVDVHPENAACDPEVCKPWGEDSYTEHGGTRRVDIVHLVLTDPRPVPPIPCKGKLGLWHLPDDIAEMLSGLHR